jgi:hypothetical protein
VKEGHPHRAAGFLRTYETGTEVARADIPVGAQILPVKVVLKIKRDSEGNPTKFKARLCVRGNLMRKEDLGSVFAPTANDKSLKLFMAIATALSLAVYGAFLFPTQKEEIFICMPPIITADEDIFWRLNKTICMVFPLPRRRFMNTSANTCYVGCDSSDPFFFWRLQRISSWPSYTSMILLSLRLPMNCWMSSSPTWKRYMLCQSPRTRNTSSA